MDKEQLHSDDMPAFNSPEYEALYNRAMKLSKEDICDLLELVGIKFATRHSNKEFTPAGRVELLETMDKDMLLDPLDEADSRSKVEQFLREKGV